MSYPRYYLRFDNGTDFHLSEQMNEGLHFGNGFLAFLGGSWRVYLPLVVDMKKWTRQNDGFINDFHGIQIAVQDLEMTDCYGTSHVDQSQIYEFCLVDQSQLWKEVDSVTVHFSSFTKEITKDRQTLSVFDRDTSMYGDNKSISLRICKYKNRLMYRELKKERE